ncbi:hypothetical protein BST83_13270 [Polaribacter filamentus]|uniref:Uncharacterized protein n=1 Tax=Polaribacter filamentus TaxID=53483 RepID=A0A2S7KZB5_9FLAO|nr:hypothetical protein [Polaribacter filamentus]PQB08014.1 hypothetical protein BST83_13270 [Polaribacter filamentus]
MATMTVASIKSELDEYVAQNKSVISTGVYAGEIEIDKYCKKLSKVKGKYPQFHKVMTRVVQGFKSEWQALGEMQFRAKALENFRQKVNLPIKVDEIYGSWLSDLKIEGKTPEEQPIAKVIIEELLEKIIDDVSDLSIIGDRSGGTADGNFGYSINGFNKLLSLVLVNTVNPCYHIPLAAITSVNVLDQMKVYERSLPKKSRKKLKQIFVSDNVALMYADAIIEKYGDHTNYNESRTTQTETHKMPIVGISDLNDNVVFCTHEENMLKLIDVIDNPATITDTQVQDYDLKIFVEFSLGYDFAINEVIFVANFDGVTPAGLQDNALNALYYASQNLPTV